MKCATHPDIETNLRCGKCGKLICPKCMVTTLVGARCRDCAGLRRLPTYQVPATYYLRALGAGVGSGLVVGFLWYLAILVVPFAGIFNILMAAAAGYGVGAAISLAVNRKRSLGLALIGAASFLLSYAPQLLLFGALSLTFSIGFGGLYLLLALFAGIFLAVSQLK